MRRFYYMAGVGRIKKILALGRLRFLSIGMALYALGSLLALFSGARFDASRIAFGYVILFLGHLSVHYSNDYFDYHADRLNQSSATSGGSGVLATDPGLLRFAGQFGLALAILSIMGAACFTAAYALPLSYLGFALLGNMVSWYYTAPPLRMAYKPWGVLASAFSVGFLMPAIGDFSTLGHFSALFKAFMIPLFLQALSFILSVQIPDMEADRLAGKWTFVALYGRGAGFLAMPVLLGTAAIYYALASFFTRSVLMEMAALVSLLPLGIALYSYFIHDEKKERSIKLVKYNVICYVASMLLMDIALALLYAYML